MAELQRRIALFVPSLEGGGAEKMLVNLANCFAARGYEVDLLLVRVVGPYAKNVAPGVRIIDLKVPRAVFATFSLARYLRRERPAVLLSVLTGANLIAIWARAVARCNTRVVVSERNHLSTASKNAQSLKLKLLPLLARWSYREADGIVGISRGVVEDLARITGLPSSRMTTIFNPVVTQDMLDARLHEGEEPPHPWLALGSTPVILGIGRLVPQKDFATLIRAFARALALRDVRLIILGEGPERSRLEALALELGVATDVDLPGFVEDPQRYLRGAGMFCMSSAWEGFGNVLVEALAAGCPAAATDCRSGPAEILESGSYGDLVPVGDDRQLAEAIMRALDRPVDRERLRDRAREFMVDTIADQYLAIMFPG